MVHKVQARRTGSPPLPECDSRIGMFPDARAHPAFAMPARYWRSMEPLGSDRVIPTAGRRAHSRLRVRLAARLTTLDGMSRAILTDLSFGGAKLLINCEVRPGQQAVLTWHDFEAFGTVSWEHGGMCGLDFDEFVAPAVLLATRDLDDADHLPSDRDLVRGIAREWVEGRRR